MMAISKEKMAELVAAREARERAMEEDPKGYENKLRKLNGYAH